MPKVKRKKKLKIPRQTRKRMPVKIRKMIREWRKTKKITTSRAVFRPKTLKRAVKQALAVEYGRARRGKRKSA